MNQPDPIWLAGRPDSPTALGLRQNMLLGSAGYIRGQVILKLFTLLVKIGGLYSCLDYTFVRDIWIHENTMLLLCAVCVCVYINERSLIDE